MSSGPIIREDTTPRVCTFVFKIKNDAEELDDEELMKNGIQSLLGSEHEVIALDRMRLSRPSVDDTVLFRHVIKVRTCSPTYVATKFMGNNWVREDHILFKSSIEASLPIDNIGNKDVSRMK